MSLEMELDKLERYQAGFERELARLEQQLDSLKMQNALVACHLKTLLQQSASEQHQDVLQEVQQTLLKQYIDTLDNHRLIADLLAQTRKALAWWKQQQATFSYHTE